MDAATIRAFQAQQQQMLAAQQAQQQHIVPPMPSLPQAMVVAPQQQVQLPQLSSSPSGPSQSDLARAKFTELMCRATGFVSIPQWMDLKEFVTAVKRFGSTTNIVKRDELTKSGKEKWTIELRFSQGTGLEELVGVATFIRDTKTQAERYTVGTQPFFRFPEDAAAQPESYSLASLL
jgi:hypothetical protein